MAFTTPPVQTPRMRPTASWFNTYIRANFNAVGNHLTASTFTPNPTGATIATNWGSGDTRVGEYFKTAGILFLWFYCQMGTSGTYAGTGVWQMELPGSISLDDTVMDLGYNNIIGGGYMYDSSTSDRYLLRMFPGATATFIRFRYDGGPAGATGVVNSTGPIPWNTSDVLAGYLRARVDL